VDPADTAVEPTLQPSRRAPRQEQDAEPDLARITGSTTISARAGAATQ